MAFSNQSTALVITGMHRSGTSLIASILQAGGVRVGDSLLAPDHLNPRGFYEDVEFLEFHQRVLYRCGHISPYVGPDFTLIPTPAEMEEARGLIEKRNNQTLWGWKDPRTCLFLDFWHQLMPEARYLFIYRHPVEVLLSLIRRREVHTSGLLEALNSWQLYNSRIETFYRQYRKQCLLVHAYTVLKQPDKCRALLADKLGIEVNIGPETIASLYHTKELHQVPVPIEAEMIFSQVHSEAINLYRRLNQLADLPDQNDSPAPQATEALAGFFKLISSLPTPLSPSQTRGILFMLTEFLRPGLLDDYFKAHNEQIVGFFKNLGQLQGQLCQQKEWTEKQEAHIQELSEYIEKQADVYQNQKNWIETLEVEVRNKQAQIETLEAEVRNKQAQIETLQTDLMVVYNSKLWQFGRRLADSPLVGMIRKFTGGQNRPT